jgi:hypothetical protein
MRPPEMVICKMGVGERMGTAEELGCRGRGSQRGYQSPNRVRLGTVEGQSRSNGESLARLTNGIGNSRPNRDHLLPGKTKWANEDDRLRRSGSNAVHRWVSGEEGGEGEGGL